MAAWSAHHRWRVVIAWVALVVLALFVSNVVGVDTGIESEGTGESQEAIDLFEDRFGEQETVVQEAVVFEHPSLTVDDPAYEETVTAVLEDLKGLVVEETVAVGDTTVVTDTRIVSETTSHYDIGAPREGSPFVAQNETGGDVTFALVDLEGDFDDALDNIGQVLAAVEDFEAPEGFEILIGGDASVFEQSEEVINEDFAFALVLNLPVTFLILILAFGAVVAALVPLALAFAAIFVALGLLAIISQFFPLFNVFSEIVLLLGLATGIDYSLFVITRYRGELRAGRSKEEALLAASGTSGKAVVFAGITVVLALTGMFFADVVEFTTLGIAAIVVVSLAIIISVTLLPALISLLGENVNRLRVPFLGRPRAGGGIWGVIADEVLARPAVTATVITVALLALAAPIITLNLGDNGARGLNDAVEAKAALLKLEENFTLGLTSPAVVLVDAGEKESVFAEDVQASVNQLIVGVQEDTVSPGNPDALYGPIVANPRVNGAGDAELILIPINGDLFDDNAIDAVNRLRDDLVPAAFDEGPAEALVTGNTAGILDAKDKIIARTPIVLAWVFALVFVLLLVVFRSIIIPIKAIILNSLSVAAAYGFLVLVFQEGLGEEVLDFESTGIIQFFLPLFLFSIIFGLSQDYHIFVLSRIKELYEGGLSNEESVSVGIKATAATITSAAVIIVAVASIFAFTRDVTLKQFGVGLAVAVLIDATVIRSVLLPASMKLLGDLNWYLPSWLEWIPRIRMEEGGVTPAESEPAGDGH